MKKRVILVFLISLIAVTILTFIITQKNITGFSVNQNSLSNEGYLENLRIKANLECLKNSRCEKGFECVENKCVSLSEIDKCEKVKLFSNTRKLELGQPINSIKSVVTDGQLNYLLADGEIVEILDDKLIEHFYIQVILIGEAKIEKENNDYIIKINNESIYTYRLMFSTGINFSSENIHRQVLKILGKEYFIDSESDNSKILLVSDNKRIKLEDEKKVKIKNGLSFNSVEDAFVNIVREEDGNIIMFEISFNMREWNKVDLKVKENYSESVFEGVKLSFDNMDHGFADVRVGGVC